ncbi:MAG TPA: hypothetical protein VNP73_09290 [Actinomycetota bacterium]|nr:hypothetical protein [Actinomycetota bacterium]
MKRLVTLILLVVVAAAFVAAPAEAGKKKKVKRVTRTAEAPYAAPGFGTATAAAGCSPALGSCGNFAIGPDDKFVKVTLTDATGTPTAFSVAQDTEPGDPTNTIETNHGTFCGTTGDTPIALVPGAEITIFIWAWGDAVCPTGVGTSGTVTAEFSNLP